VERDFRRYSPAEPYRSSLRLGCRCGHRRVVVPLAAVALPSFRFRASAITPSCISADKRRFSFLVRRISAPDRLCRVPATIRASERTSLPFCDSASGPRPSFRPELRKITAIAIACEALVRYPTLTAHKPRSFSSLLWRSVSVLRSTTDRFLPAQDDDSIFAACRSRRATADSQRGSRSPLRWRRSPVPRQGRLQRI